MNLKTITLFFFGCFISTAIYAQQSSYKRINDIPVLQNGDSLKNPWAGGLNHPFFSEIDLNGDGLKDLFAFDKAITNGYPGRIECFINQGSPNSVDYKFSSDYFFNFPFLHDWVLLRDYNCDGKEDIFAFSDDFNGIKVYENVSSGGNLQFNLVTPKLTEAVQNGGTFTILKNPNLCPAILDVDNDGDIDILALTGIPNRTVEYYKNLSEENGWGCDSLAFEYVTSCWGNFSFDSTSNSVCPTCWKCPNGIHLDKFNFNYNPAEAAPRDDSLTSIFAFDENGDGAKDLLIGDLAATNSLLVLNGGTPDTANMVSQDRNFPGYDIPVNLPDFTNHAYIDVDNDGKKDLLVSSTFKTDMNNILFYKNNGTDSVPVFSFQSNSFLQDEMIDVGEGCYPVFFDYDGDGLMDIVIGNVDYTSQTDNVGASLTLYRNIGTKTSPAFELVTTDYGNISSLNLPGPIFPAFGDLNGDGRPDLIIGDGNGNLTYFINASSSGPANFQYDTANYKGIDVGDNAAPQLIDLDRDGHPDLVIGSRDGYLNYYRNIGTKNNANFDSTPTIASLGNANTAYGIGDGYSVPFIYNDSAGKYEMFLAGGQGYVFHYNNIDNNLHGIFTLTDTIINLSEGQMLGVSGADINNDGKIDLIVGNYSGGAGIFSQNMPLSVPDFTEVKPSFEILPNPAASILTVRFYNLKEAGSALSITDMLGRVVKTAPVNGTNLNLDISYLSNGIYLVVLQSAKFYVTRKLVVRH